jgi:hypothetical protein
MSCIWEWAMHTTFGEESSRQTMCLSPTRRFGWTESLHLWFLASWQRPWCTMTALSLVQQLTSSYACGWPIVLRKQPLRITICHTHAYMCQRQQDNKCAPFNPLMYMRNGLKHKSLESAIGLIMTAFRHSFVFERRDADCVRIRSWSQWPDLSTGTRASRPQSATLSYWLYTSLICTCKGTVVPRYSRLGYSRISVIVGFFARTNVHWGKNTVTDIVGFRL